MAIRLGHIDAIIVHRRESSKPHRLCPIIGPYLQPLNREPRFHGQRANSGDSVQETRQGKVTTIPIERYPLATQNQAWFAGTIAPAMCAAVLEMKEDAREMT